MTPTVQEIIKFLVNLGTTDGRDLAQRIVDNGVSFPFWDSIDNKTVQWSMPDNVMDAGTPVDEDGDDMEYDDLAVARALNG